MFCFSGTTVGQTSILACPMQTLNSNSANPVNMLHVSLNDICFMAAVVEKVGSESNYRVTDYKKGL